VNRASGFGVECRIGGEDRQAKNTQKTRLQGWAYHVYMVAMSTKTRLNLEVSPELYADLQQISEDGHTTMSNVFRLAFALYKVCHQAKKEGHHVGLVKDPKKLDRELVGLI
jgi:hypothetical protein